MFLSRFRVRGYKCLEDVEVALTPFHAIVGPNDAGKSSLLEAISALYGRLKTPPARWFPASDSPRDLVTHKSDVPAIDLAGQWSQERLPDGRPSVAAGYGLSIIVPTSGENLAVMDQWVRPRASDDPRAGLTRKAFAFPQSSGPATAEDRAAQAAFHDIIQPVLQPAPVYRLEPRRLAEAVAADGEQPASLHADGHGLAALLQEIEAKHSERFAEIQKEFCPLAPRYRGLSLRMELLRSKKTARGGKAGLEPPLACGLCLETSAGRTVPAREVSSGTLLTLALVTLAHLPAPPALLLIENPEQGIHPSRLADLIGLLRRLTQWSEGCPSVQVIVTTHSPAVQSLFEPQETTILSRSEEQPDGAVIAKSLAEQKA